jgi:hypothetical protein
LIVEPAKVPVAWRAWLADGAAGATVSPDGTVDWYQHDSPTGAVLLWRLYDPGGPALRVGVRGGTPPAAGGSGNVSYLGDSNVARIVQRASSGRCVELSDFFAWPTDSFQRAKGLQRHLRVLAGPVDVEVELVAGGHSRVTALPGGLRLGGLSVRLGGRLAGGTFQGSSYGRDSQRWLAEAALETGDVITVTLAADADPTVADVPGDLYSTVANWQRWAGNVRYDGPYRDAVVRAALTVRSLTGPLGAPGGGGTTSLPRRLGGEGSEDLRWVRMRDVARTSAALAALGLYEDALAAESWLRATIAQASRPWPAFYDKDGQPAPEAVELPWKGWRGHQPVLAGAPNLRVDAETLAEVVGAVGVTFAHADVTVRDEGPLSAAWGDITTAVDDLCDTWSSPRPARWPALGRDNLHTSGVLAAWDALAVAAGRARRLNPLDMQAAGWRSEASRVADHLDKLAGEGRGSLCSHPGSDLPDSSLLQVAWRGPWPSNHPVVASTVERALGALSAGLFVYRAAQGVPGSASPPDNPDLEATFMAVRALAALDRWEEAHERMEAATRAIARSGPGVITETFDPTSESTLGNVACAAAALAAIEAALALEKGPR